VGVYNEAGELVREILVREFSQPVDDIQVLADDVIDSLDDRADLYYRGYLIGTWDGTNQAGEPVGNGEYLVKIDNVDGYGVVQTITQQVTVNRGLSEVSITVFNASGEAVRHLYSEVDDPTRLVTQVMLSHDTIEPSYWAPEPGQVTETSIQLSNGVAVAWDGRSDSGVIVANGQYYVEIRSYDGSGGEIVVTREVAVYASATSYEKAVVAPNVLTAEHPVAHIGVTNPLRLRVGIYNVAGEKVTTLYSDGPTGWVEWSALGAANGLYLARIELFDASGKILGVQTSKIINLTH